MDTSLEMGPCTARRAGGAKNCPLGGLPGGVWGICGGSRLFPTERAQECRCGVEHVELV